MSTTSYDKEYLLCFTFAYFAQYPDYQNTAHQESLEDLFTNVVFAKEYQGIAKRGEYPTAAILRLLKKQKLKPSVVPAPKKTQTVLRQRLGQHLSVKFDFEKLFTSYANSITPSGLLQVHPSVKKTYNQVKSFCESGIIPARKLRDYQFLDQNDPFTEAMKNAPLKKIVSVLKLRGGKTQHEILNPADLFIVKATKKASVLQQMSHHITSADDLTVLGNMVTQTHSYRRLFQQWMSDGSVFAVSHKLPVTIGRAANPKIVGATAYGSGSENQAAYNKFIDPFGQLIGILMLNPQDIGSVFDKVMDIEFDKFDLREQIGSWTMPITFNYKRVFSEYNIDTRHLPSKIRLLLLNWQDAGFNGKWEIDSQAGTWIGGMGSGESFALFDKYDRSIVREVIDRRIQVFTDTFGSPPKDTNARAAYDSVLKLLSAESVFKPTKGSKQLIQNLIDAMETNISVHTFLGRIVLAYRKELPIAYSPAKVSEKNMPSHVVHSQLAYFMYRGGKSYQTRLKKMIATSIYGIISKSSYKVFGATGLDTYEVRSYFQKKFSTATGEKMVAEFHVAPHIVIG